MAAALKSDEPHAMFARLFTSCFHRRPERAPPSPKSHLPPESSSEAGAESSGSAFPSRFSQQSLPRQPSDPILQTELPTKPPPAINTKDPDMAKARPAAAAKPAAKSVAKPAPKPKAAKPPKVAKTTKASRAEQPKSKYFAGAEPDSEYGSGRSTRSREDILNEMFNSLRGRSSPTAHTAEDASTNKDKGESEDDSIGVESIDQYTRLLGVNMYNFEFFVLCEILQPGTLGQISRKEFVNGWKNQTRSPGVPLEPSMDEHKKFIRSRIQQLPRDPVLFKKVYRQTFMSGKESHQKAIPKEVAITFWDELFSPTLRPWKTAKVDWLDAWERYLADNWKRSVNKDMWNQTLEFAIKTMEDETLSFWTENQAWPGVIDDFVVWCREEGVVASPKKNADGMEVDE